MIDKVLIAEDQESTNLAVQRTMEELRIPHIDRVFYCDDALHKINLAKEKGAPYDLLITDLLFQPDERPQEIKTGFDLIAAVRKAHPATWILAFSAMEKTIRLEILNATGEINGYIRKGRTDTQELKAALAAFSKGQNYFPRSFSQFIRPSQSYTFTEFDLHIVKLLAQGYLQNQIPDYLRQHNITPSSLSSIEKRLNQIRAELGFTKNEQLVLHCKERGLL